MNTPTAAGAKVGHTPFETYRAHREACHVCRGNGAFTGPICGIGKQLRNLAIDNTDEPPAPLLARLESSDAQYTNSTGGFTGAVREVNGDMLVANVFGRSVEHLNARRDRQCSAPHRAT